MTKTAGHIELKSKTLVEDIKTADYDSLNLLCAEIRDEIVKATAKNGGHLSSNLGAVEATVSLHRVFDFPKDKLIFDVGHQSYAHKLLTGRSLEKLGKKDGISEFQNMQESVYDPYSAGHSSTSISAAEGFALIRDQKRENHEVIAFIGDASIVNGLAFEAINHLACLRTKVIIVVNDNDMSITPAVGGLSHFGPHIGDIMTEMGYEYIGPVDGHDIRALDEAFKKSKKSSRSVFVHIKTKKGKGYAPAEADTYGYWHASSPFDIATGKPLDMHEDKISWSHLFADIAERILSHHKDANLIVPATLKGSNLDDCFSKFPERCFDVGIAEEHAFTLASGMALAGSHPIVSIYSTFLQRAYDEVIHDCARQDTNMTVFVDRAGFIGMSGATHHGIYDVAYLMSIPNVIITMPSTKDEALSLAHESMQDHGVFFIRYPREYIDKSDYKRELLPFGRWKFVAECEDKKLAIVAPGPDGLSLFKLLKEQGISITYVNPLYLNFFDKADVSKLLDYQNILCYDSYSTEAGFASRFGSILMKAGYKGNYVSKAIADEFVHHMSIKEQKSLFGLNPTEMADFVKANFEF